MNERVDQLGRRVRWLDRARRPVALLVGLAVALLVAYKMEEAMGDEWPQIHASLCSVIVGIVAWLVAEIALAGVTAFWETEHDRLLRDHGLPRAELHRPARCFRWFR